MSLADILRAVTARDPDGWPTEPTDEDRRRFREWVVRTYGPKMWDVYNQPRWEPSP